MVFQINITTSAPCFLFSFLLKFNLKEELEYQYCTNAETKPLWELDTTTGIPNKNYISMFGVRIGISHYLVIVSSVGHATSVIISSVGVAAAAATTTTGWKDRTTRIWIAYCSTTAAATSSTLRHIATSPVIATAISRDYEKRFVSAAI